MCNFKWAMYQAKVFGDIWYQSVKSVIRYSWNCTMVKIIFFLCSGSTLCFLHLLIPSRPLILSGNDTIILGPYHTFYGKLDEHMQRVGLSTQPNMWDQPLCVGTCWKRCPFTWCLWYLHNMKLSLWLLTRRRIKQLVEVFIGLFFNLLNRCRSPGEYYTFTVPFEVQGPTMVRFSRNKNS